MVSQAGLQVQVCVSFICAWATLELGQYKEMYCEMAMLYAHSQYHACYNSYTLLHALA